MFTFMHSVLLSFIVTVSTLYAQGISISSTCNLESDNVKLGRCLRPWLDVWETVQVKNARASNILLPALMFSEHSTKMLCKEYHKSRQYCFDPSVIRRCHKNKLLFFARAQMEYFCAKKSSEITDHLKCSQRLLRKNDTCLQLVRGRPNSIDKNKICNNVQKFFLCFQEELEASCGKDSVQMFQMMYDDIGCKNLAQRHLQQRIHKNSSRHYRFGINATTEEDRTQIQILNDEGETIVDTETEESEIPSCYSKLIRKWDTLYSSCSSEVPLPMYYCDEAAIVNLCDEYSIALEVCIPESSLKRWRGNKVVEFMDQQLSILCVNQDGNHLSGSYSCLRNVTATKISCLQDVKNTFRGWSFCRNVPEYFSCIESELRTICGSDAVTLFLDMFRHYGCSFNARSYYVEKHIDGIFQNEMRFNASKETSNVPTTKSMMVEEKEQQTMLESDLLSGLKLGDVEFAKNVQQDTAEHYKAADGNADNAKLAKTFEESVSEPDAWDQSFFHNFAGYDNNNKNEPVIDNNNTFTRSMDTELQSTHLSAESNAYSNKSEEDLITIYKDTNILMNPNYDEADTTENVSLPIQWQHANYVVPEVDLKVESENNSDKSFVLQTVPNSTLHSTTAERLTFASSTDNQCFGIATALEQCMLPLLKLLDNINNDRILLSKSFFPLFQYTQVELTSLCDEYVNTIRCANDLQRNACRNYLGQLYSVNRIFGYVCKTDNLGGFAREHSCISQLSDNTSNRCQQFITVVWHINDKETCDRLQLYYRCLEEDLNDVCGVNAVQQFKMSAEHYGCNITSSI